MPQALGEATSAWARLVRVQQSLQSAVERDLKAAGFPPLAWYDALLELSRAPRGELRPVELEKQMLMPQYSTSRLVDRLVEAASLSARLVRWMAAVRFAAITPTGRNMQKRMWETYAAAIERHVGSKLTCKEAAGLHDLLGKLA